MQSPRHCHNASQFVRLIISFVPHVHFLHNWRGLSTNQLCNLLTLFPLCPLIGNVGVWVSQSIRARWQREKPATGRTGPGVGPNIYLGDHWFECRPAHWLSKVGEGGGGASIVTAPGSKMNILHDKKRLCSTNCRCIMKKQNQQAHVQICKFIVLYTAFWGLRCL